MRNLIFISFAFLVSCNNEKTLKITPAQIDQYVQECLDTAIIYDILMGPRYSKEDESFQVTEYSRNDSTILFVTEEFSNNSATQLNVYYKEEMPVYIESYVSNFTESSTEFVEQKVYLNGSEVIQAEERRALSELELAEAKFKKIDISKEVFNLTRLENATYQKEEFELAFSEFLIINPESYLILKNSESGYSVALYILEGDEMLDELYSQPDVYRGKKVKFNYEFTKMNGIERLIYRGVELVDKKPS